MSSPTSAATITIGSDTYMHSSMPWVVKRTSVSISMRAVSASQCDKCDAALAVGHHEAVNQRRPAVHHDEQQQLERNRHVGRRHLVEAHREQHVGDAPVEHDER